MHKPFTVSLSRKALVPLHVSQYHLLAKAVTLRSHMADKFNKNKINTSINKLLEEIENPSLVTVIIF